MPRKDQLPSESGFRVPVAIYTRVSTDNQVGGRFDSCESQAVVCRDTIRKHAGEGWYEVASFTDAAYSGGTMERPGIQSLKRMIQAGEVKVVLIFKLERVSRNMDEWGPFRSFLQKHGCRLESATENISELEPEGRLKNNIMMSVAEFERLNTAKKTRLKMREQAKRGYWNGGPVPYGYGYDKNTQALQFHPVEGPILRKIFTEAAKLTSLTDLANMLNAAGHRTKERVMQRRDGKIETVGGRQFRSDGLRLLIRNPIYRGAVKFEGQEFAGKHEALVDADLWERANAAVTESQERSESVIKHPAFQARDAHHHLFKGIAWCASCGRALVPSDSGKKSVKGTKYRYYTCSLVLKESKSPCPVGRLSAEALETAVVSVLGEAAKHPSIVKEIVEASRSSRHRDVATLRQEIAKEKQILVSIDRQLGNCAEAVAQGGAEVLGDALVRRATALREERRRILVREEKLRQELVTANGVVMEEGRVRKNLERFSELLPKLTREEQKELVNLFIDRIDVRRAVDPSRKRRSRGEQVAANDRLMEIRIKLHDAELAEGVATRVETANAPRPIPHLRSLGLDARVDFSNAGRGEIALVSPFRQTVRLDHRVRTVSIPPPATVHPIIRARKWHQMLLKGEVGNRLALAKRVGTDPAMVTRVLKLVQLGPEIQDYLERIKSASGVWHFSIKALGRIADLPPSQQVPAFDALVERFEERERLNSKTVSLPAETRRKRSGVPRVFAG